MLQDIKNPPSTENGFSFGAPKGTRTPDLPLRRRLLYPAELLKLVLKENRQILDGLERVMGIEPTRPAWKAGILAIELHPHSYDLSILTQFKTVVKCFLKYF